MSSFTLTIEQRDEFERTLAKLRAWHECVLLLLVEHLDQEISFGLALFFEELDAEITSFISEK